jgi:O-antigen/teichoic acid export membrane protein
MMLISRLKNLIVSPGFKKYFANTSWLMAERVLRMVVALFVGVYVARYLGPERFGLLSYANSFVGLFVALATLGLDGIVVRELVKTPERRDELLGTAFWLKIGGAILMWIAIIAAVPLTNNDIQTNTLIAIIAFTAVFQAFNVIDFNYQAEVKSKYVVRAQLIQLVLSSITKLVLIFIEAPLLWFAWVYCLDAVVLAVGLAVMYLQNNGKLWAWQWRWQVAKALLMDSWPLMFAYMSYLIYARIDQVMIKEMLGEHSVGIYSVAYQLYEAPLFIALLVSKSVYPLIVKYYQSNKIRLFDIYLKLSSYMTLLSYIIVIIFLVFSENIILILYGEKYYESANVLLFLSFGLIPMFNAFLRSSYIIISGNQKIILYTTLFSAITNILLNIYFIRNFGVIGATYATVMTQLLSLLFLNAVFMSTRKIFVIQIKALLLLGVWKELWRKNNATSL